MKRILILLLALMPMMTGAQDYKPLGSVEVPDFPSNKIYISESDFPRTEYTSSFGMLGYGIDAALATSVAPAEFDLFFNVDNADSYNGLQARISIGGDQYSRTVFWVNRGKVYIDILGPHIKHIAVSGLQKVEFVKMGNVIHSKDFNDIEQELWRRAAEELKKKIDKFNIL